LDAGADFFDFVSALEYADGTTATAERERRAKPAEPATGNQDRKLFLHGAARFRDGIESVPSRYYVRRFRAPMFEA
jgi:hypothetical protein